MRAAVDDYLVNVAKLAPALVLVVAEETNDEVLLYNASDCQSDASRLLDHTFHVMGICSRRTERIWKLEPRYLGRAALWRKPVT